MNRSIQVECSPDCRGGAACKNRRFQKWRLEKDRDGPFKTTPFRAEGKGLGLKALEKIPKGSFICEFLGEVISKEEMLRRDVDLDKRYFVQLSSDRFLDARYYGSHSRYLNHSCDPNCMTEKWEVNGVMTIGIFAAKNINAGDEMCFDYQWANMKDPIKCMCGSKNCRLLLGATKEQIEDYRQTLKESKMVDGGDLDARAGDVGDDGDQSSSG